MLRQVRHALTPTALPDPTDKSLLLLPLMGFL
jgi:hypothetical protein